MKTKFKQTMSIDALVHWAYAVEKVDVMASRSTVRLSYGYANNQAVFELGTHIDCSPSYYDCFGSAGAPDDAMTLHDQVLLLSADAFFLVITHGRTDTAPNWYPAGPGREVEITDGRGRRKPIYRDQINRTGIIGYQKHWVGHRPETVEFGRAQYTLWYEALVCLENAVRERLESHDVTAPAVSATPWLDRRPVIRYAIAPELRKQPIEIKINSPKNVGSCGCCLT